MYFLKYPHGVYIVLTILLGKSRASKERNLHVVDRRSFVAGFGMSSLPISTEAAIKNTVVPGDLAKFLQDFQGLSSGTATAMASRAERLIGDRCSILIGDVNGLDVEFTQQMERRRNWLLRGVPSSEALLANAVGLACTRASEQLNRTRSSFRWFSGCSFGSAAAHLFRGNKSKLLVVMRGHPENAGLARLDVVTT